MKVGDPKGDQNQKLLIMGDEKAGKTCIHATLFADFTAFETRSLPFTNSINESKVVFLGYNLKINDCGGQSRFMNDYLGKLAVQLFASVGFLFFNSEDIIFL